MDTVERACTEGLPTGALPLLEQHTPWHSSVVSLLADKANIEQVEVACAQREEETDVHSGAYDGPLDI